MASLMEMGLCNFGAFRGVKPNEFELEGGMVVYATGPKGSGKTTLLAHLAGTQMLPPLSCKKVFAARKEADYLRDVKGYKKAEIPKIVNHLVYSDIIIETSKDQGYLPRYSWDLDIERMKVPGADTNVQFFPLGATIVIDELMEKFDARDFNKKDAGMPAELRRFLQTCRHRDIAVLTGCLLASGSDKRFRQMSQNILLIVHRTDDFKDKKLVRTTWYCLEFASAESCDKFLESKKDVFYTPRIFVHCGNIRECTDSYAENDSFIAGLESREIEFRRRGA